MRRPVGYESAIWANTMSPNTNVARPIVEATRRVGIGVRKVGHDHEHRPQVHELSHPRRRAPGPGPEADEHRHRHRGEEVEHPRRPPLRGAPVRSDRARSARIPVPRPATIRAYARPAARASRPHQELRERDARKAGLRDEAAGRRRAECRAEVARAATRGQHHVGRSLRRRPAWRRPRGRSDPGAGRRAAPRRVAASASPRSRPLRPRPRRRRRSPRPRASAARTSGRSDGRRRSRQS